MSMMEVATLGVVVKSDGVSQTSSALSGLGTSAKNAETKVTSLTASVEKLMKVQGTATSVALSYANALSGVQQGVTGVNSSAAGLQGATAALVNAISSLTSGLASAQRNFSNINTTIPQSTRVIREHTSAMRDAHDMARGLSGGLGALWLTYGNIAPMVAGVALAKGFLEATKAGTEFAYQLTFVKALGGESAESVKEVGNAALQLSKSSLYGPIEMANGLRILSQAGLSAKDSLMALPKVLDLATVGEMNMEQAAITLTGVMNAFNLKITDMAHIGDVFAKAAAESQTSVVAMTEAMKTASVVGAQYGVTMEDTATALTLLAKMNITGTAAGTAFRNMLKELYSPGKEAKEIMKAIGISASDAAGNLRPMSDVIYDLKGKIEQYDKVSQINILQKLFGERGAKEAIAMLSLTKEKWEELHDSIANSDGFMTKVAAELEMTVKGRFKQAVNAMEASLIEAFNSSSNSAQSLTDKLRELADSETFKTGIKNIVSVAMNLTEALVTLAPVVIKVGEAWLAWKVLTSVAAGVVALQTAVEAARISMLAFGAAQAAFVGPQMVGAVGSLASFRVGLLGVSEAAAVAGGSTGLAGLATTLTTLFSAGGLITLGIAALAGLAYAFHKFASDTPEVVKQAESFTQAIDRQVTKIKEANAELEKNLQLKAKNLGKDDFDADPVKDNIATIQQQLADARNKMQKEGWSISLNATIGNLDHQLQQAQQGLADGLAAQAKQTTLNLRSLLLDMEKEANKIDTAAAKQGTANSTAILRQAIEAYKQNADAVTDPKVLRGLQNYFQETLNDARMSTGSKHLTPTDPAAIKDEWRAKLIALDGEVASAQRSAADAEAYYTQLNKQGLIGDISLLEIKKVLQQGVHQDAIESLEKEANLAAPDKTKARHQEIENNLQKHRDILKGITQKTTEEENTITAKAVERSLATTVAGLKAEGKYVEAFQAEFNATNDTTRKKLQSDIASGLLLPEQVEQAKKQLEDLNATLAKGTAAASFKETDFAAQATIRTIEEGVAQINSYTTDGSLISSWFKADALYNLYNTDLPKLQKELYDLNQKQLASGADVDKKAYETRLRDYYKFVKQQRDVYKDFIDTVDKWGSEGFQAIFSKTEGAWTSYVKKMKDSFKTYLIDEIYKMLARPFVLNILAMIANGAGATGLSGALQTAANGGNSATGLVNAGSTAYSLYGSLSGYSAAYSAGAGLTSAEAAAASQAYYQAGYYGTGAAIEAGQAIGGTTAATATGAEVGGTAAAAEGSSGLMSSLSSAASAVPVWGWVVLAVIAILSASGAFSAGVPKLNINTGFKATATGAVAQPLDNGTTTYGGGQDSLAQAIYTDAVKAIVAKYDPSAAYDVKFGGHINLEGRSSNQDFAKIRNTNGDMVYDAFMESGKGTGDFQSWAVQEIPKMQLALITTAMRNAGGDIKEIANAIMGTATNLTDSITKMSADQVTQAVTNLNNFVAVFNTIKETLNKSITGEALANLAALSGGIANLTTLTSAYYQGYFTDAEKNAKLQSQLNEQFVQLNLTMPTTREGFRALVEGLDLTTVNGQQTFVKLMSLSSSFGTFADALKNMQTTVEDNTTAIKAEQAAQAMQVSLADKYASSQQKLSLAVAALVSGFSSLGMKVPTTVEQFHALIVGAESTTVSGRNLLNVLNQLSPAFDTVMASSNTALQNAMATVDDAMSKLSKSIESEKNRIEKNYNDQVTAIKNKAEDDKKLLQDQISLSTASLSAIQTVFTKLEGTAKALQGDITLQQLSDARRLLNAALSSSNTGGSLGNYAGLQDALDIVAKPSEQLYSSFEEYSAAQARTSNTINALKLNAGDQVSVAQLTLKATQDAITAIDSTSAASLKALDDQHTADIQRLDDILAKSQDQVNVLKGIDTSVLSVTAAVNALNSAITAAMVAKNGSATPATVTPATGLTATEAAKVTQATNAINTLNNSDLFWTAKAGGSVTAQQLVKAYAPNWNPTSDQLAYWTNQIATQGATNAIAQFVNPQDMTAARIPFLNSHATGLERVPYDNYMAQLHEGEAVIDAPAMRAFKRYFNAEITPPRQDGRANEELCNEVRQLRAELQAANVAIAQNTGRTAKQLERWDGDGLPETRTV